MDCRRPSSVCIHVGWRLPSTGSCGDKRDLEVHATPPSTHLSHLNFSGGACWRKGFFGKVKCDEWKTGFRISWKWLQTSHLQFLHYLFIDFSIFIYPGDPFYPVPMFVAKFHSVKNKVNLKSLTFHFKSRTHSL